MIYSSYQVRSFTCLKSFRGLWLYPSKVSSAWGKVWSITWPSTTSITAPEVRDLGDFLSFWAGWWCVITKCIKLPTWNHSFSFLHTQARYLALGPRFWQRLSPQRCLLCPPRGRDLGYFSVSRWTGVYNSYQVDSFNWVKSYLYLWTYKKKGFSSGGTVWSGTWPSTASITAFVGRDLRKFYDFWRAGDM